MTLYKHHHDAFFARYKNAKENPNYPRLFLLREKIIDMRLEIEARRKECTEKKLAIAKENYDRLLRGNGVEPLERHLDSLQSQFIKIAATILPLAPEKVISGPDPKQRRVLRTNPTRASRSVSQWQPLAREAKSPRRTPAPRRK